MHPRDPRDFPFGSRSTADPAFVSNIFVQLEEIRDAWEQAKLSRRERQALFVLFGVDETEVVAARVLDVSVSTVQKWRRQGVGKIVEHLYSVDLGLEEGDG
jgi:hypothetical protein